MSDRNMMLYLVDILDSANAIKQFLDGMSYEQFITDRKTYSATLREFIVIGEAVGKLIEPLGQRFPDYEWRMIKDFRNFIVHEYFGMDERIVWDAAQNELPLLETMTRTLKDEIEWPNWSAAAWHRFFLTATRHRLNKAVTLQFTDQRMAKIRGGSPKRKRGHARHSK